MNACTHRKYRDRAVRAGQVFFSLSSTRYSRVPRPRDTRAEADRSSGRCAQGARTTTECHDTCEGARRTRVPRRATHSLAEDKYPADFPPPHSEVFSSFVGCCGASTGQIDHGERVRATMFNSNCESVQRSRRLKCQ